MSSRRACIWLAIGLLAVLASACSLDIVKRRLAAPHPVEGGILFQYEAPAATVVTLAGNWEGNWWGGTASSNARYDNSIGRMENPDGDGIWTRIEDLPPGRYQYKFVIDNNTWNTDPNNPSTAQEGGFTNSLLVVK